MISQHHWGGVEGWVVVGVSLSSALMEADRHFVGIWRLYHAKTDAQSSDRKAARNLTREPCTIWPHGRLIDSFPFQICVCTTGWLALLCDRDSGLHCVQFARVRLRGFFSPDSPASSHSPNTCTLWIIGKLKLSVGVKLAS